MRQLHAGVNFSGTLGYFDIYSMGITCVQTWYLDSKHNWCTIICDTLLRGFGTVITLGLWPHGIDVSRSQQLLASCYVCGRCHPALSETLFTGRGAAVVVVAAPMIYDMACLVKVTMN